MPFKDFFLTYLTPIKCQAQTDSKLSFIIHKTCLLSSSQAVSLNVIELHTEMHGWHSNLYLGLSVANSVLLALTGSQRYCTENEVNLPWLVPLYTFIKYANVWLCVNCSNMKNVIGGRNDRWIQHNYFYIDF